MSKTSNAIKLGFKRSWIEFKQFLASPQDLIWTLFITIIMLVVVWFQRNSEIEGVSLALLTLPSLLGFTIAMGGFTGAAGQISYDREDGTLLRARAVPQGIIGYVVSRILYVVYSTLVSVVLLLVPAAFIVSGLVDNITLADFGMFVLIFMLGLLATAPLGAIVGALVKNSSSGYGLTMLPIMGLSAISGIFYPITALAAWLQIIGQIFPIYWIGLGMRSVFLPEAAAVAEIGGSWRLAEMILILLAWMIIGLVFAPRVLRRMTRKATGSDMEARKQETLSRGY